MRYQDENIVLRVNVYERFIAHIITKQRFNEKGLFNCELCKYTLYEKTLYSCV